MKMKTYKGVLTKIKDRTFLVDKKGKRHLETDRIWEGYAGHWLGKEVCARLLPQKDYEEGKPIVIMWPAPESSVENFVELYYNERLVKYPASLMGHIAINVNDEIFNYSHLLNENEALTPEEYFYRPPLGEFAPHPETGLYNDDDPEKPYYDKFGRLFMRTIHVMRIEGLDTEGLSHIYHNYLKVIHGTPINPKKPEYYKDFNIFKRSCATNIRNGLRKYGDPKISGIFPRDLFVNAAYHLLKVKDRLKIKIDIFKMKQLKVPEAPESAITPLFNPMNRYREKSIAKYYQK